MAKKLNTPASKKELLDKINVATKSLEYWRWLESPEGKEAALLLEQQRQCNLRRKDIQIGQLVWKEAVAFFDLNTPQERAEKVNVCYKISAIEKETVTIKMLYVAIGDEKADEYTDFLGEVRAKGYEFVVGILGLEKHLSKTTGNIWWKIVSF